MRLWREFQGAGRHDAPDRYGCLYLAEVEVCAVAEALATFRGTGDVRPELLVRAGRQLALVELELASGAVLIDLDDPAVLVAEQLPSTVATGDRTVTQSYAIRQFITHAHAAGLRWWSTLEASWPQVTLFDRAVGGLTVRSLRVLTVWDDAVTAAAGFLGLTRLWGPAVRRLATGRTETASGAPDSARLGVAGPRRSSRG